MVNKWEQRDPEPKAASEVFLALKRIRAALRKSNYEKKKVAPNTGRDIRLGLDRISTVVSRTQTWRGVHIGGTNGKGSICAFLAGLFRLAGVSHGVFTSPAFPERHNGVLINGQFTNKRMYEAEVARVQLREAHNHKRWTFNPYSKVRSEHLSPFELDTATAFGVFNRMNVKYGIVEVGMGGETDATNIMKRKHVTVISKIDLDHQEYLGDTIEEIAKVKAGIMRAGVPCIVDHTNSKDVIAVLRKHADNIGTRIYLSWKGLAMLKPFNLDQYELEDYQIQNLLCAAMAFRHLFPHMPIDIEKLLDSEPFLPGRMEYVGLGQLTDGVRKKQVLLDGAHNMLGVEALAEHVKGKLRLGQLPVTWVIAMSSSTSKPFADMVEKLIQPQDNIAFVEFEQGLNDPRPVPAALGRDVAMSLVDSKEQVFDGESTLKAGVQWASDKAKNGPMVITGSLYLIRDLYSLSGVSSRRMPGERRPGRAQLWRYIRTAQNRRLTPEESREFKRARRHFWESPIRKNSAVSKNLNSTRRGVPEAQRKAARHKEAANKHRIVLGETKQKLASSNPGEDHSALHQLVSDTRKLIRKERVLEQRTMQYVRGHGVMPGKKWLSYNEVFGRPPPPGMLKPAASHLFQGYEEPREDGRPRKRAVPQHETTPSGFRTDKLSRRRKAARKVGGKAIKRRRWVLRMMPKGRLARHRRVRGPERVRQARFRQVLKAARERLKGQAP